MIKELQRLMIYAILILTQLNCFSQEVVINEIMSCNTAGIQDHENEYIDWIELYNKSGEVIDLHNYGISDDSDDLNKFKLPNVEIQPFSYLVLYASGKNIDSVPFIHTNFKIKQSGEEITLVNSKNELVSTYPAVFIPENLSYGCVEDGKDDLAILNSPTPGASNGKNLKLFSSHESGFYTEDFTFKIFSSIPGFKIHYTLNGDIPNSKSNLYNSQITVTNNQTHPLNISQIPSTPLEGEYQLYQFVWKEPQSVYRSTVVRFAAFKNDSLKSEVYTKSFFVDSTIFDHYDYPILSLVTDSLSLFDYDTGIYIPGKRFDENGFNWFPEGNYHNRGREWERRVHLSYFEKDGALGFEGSAGMRMRGFGSTSMPQKSFGTYFRKSYGMKNIKYPIFDDDETSKYKRLVFRNGGNDFLFSHFKDAMLQKVIEELDLELQNSKPSVVFFNGEYWGLYNIREKYDKYYFKYKFDIEEEDINILGVCGSIEEGSNTDFLDLKKYFEEHDISLDEHFDYVSEKMDISNFIDYNIAEIYYANYDWPCNNYKIWKDNKPNSKWRFLIHDLDLSFGNDKNSQYTKASMEHAVSTASGFQFCSCSNLMLRKLLENETFKNRFIKRFEYCLNNTFKSERVTGFIEDFRAKYSSGIAEHIERWNYPKNVDSWNNEVEKLKTFAEKRPCAMKNNLKLFFNLSKIDFDCQSEANQDNPESIGLFPNPNKGNFLLENNMSEAISSGKVMVYNSIGQIVYSLSNVNIKPSESQNFYINNLPKGYYILVLKTPFFVKERKFMIY